MRFAQSLKAIRTTSHNFLRGTFVRENQLRFSQERREELTSMQSRSSASLLQVTPPPSPLPGLSTPSRAVAGSARSSEGVFLEPGRSVAPRVCVRLHL